MRIIITFLITILSASISTSQDLEFAERYIAGDFDQLIISDSSRYHIGRVYNNVNIGYEGNVTNVLGDGNKIVTYITKFDENRNLEWSRIIPYIPSSSIKSVDNGGYLYITTSQTTNDGITYRCHRINKSDPDDLKLVFTFKTGSSGARFKLAFDQNNKVGVFGTYRDFIEVNNSIKYNAVGPDDNFVLKYNEWGNSLIFSNIIKREWGRPGPNNRDHRIMTFDEDNTLHLVGKYEDSAQLGDNQGPAISNNNGGYYIASFDETGNNTQFKKTNVYSYEDKYPLIPLDSNFIVINYGDALLLDSKFNLIKEIDNLQFSTAIFKDYIVSEDKISFLLNFAPNTTFRFKDFTFKPNKNCLAILQVDKELNPLWFQIVSDDAGNIGGLGLYTNQSDDIILHGFVDNDVDIDPSLKQFIVQKNNYFIANYSQECSGLQFKSIDVTKVTCTNDGTATIQYEGGYPQVEAYWLEAPSSNQLITSDPGVYQAILTDSLGCSKTIDIPIGGPSEENKIFLTHTHSEYRTGFDGKISLSLRNPSCIPLDGTIQLELNDQLTYLGANITPTNIDNQKLTFDVNQLDYDEGPYTIILDINISDQAQFGINLCSKVWFYNQIGEKVIADVICGEVINSYDPNDIQVTPNGRCDENYFLKEEYLTYRIRFQNLGNAEAINVHIVDTLDQAFDIQSFETLESSHPAFVYIENNNLHIEYDSILLPAEVQDEVASNGHFEYRIKTKTSTSAATNITNLADIYFDFNAPVRTNEVSSELVDVLPECIVTGVNEIDIYTTILYPNPSNSLISVSSDQLIDYKSLRIINQQGQQVECKISSNNQKLEINISTLPVGVYYIKSGSYIGRFVKI